MPLPQWSLEVAHVESVLQSADDDGGWESWWRKHLTIDMKKLQLSGVTTLLMAKKMRNERFNSTSTDNGIVIYWGAEEPNRKYLTLHVLLWSVVLSMPHNPNIFTLLAKLPKVKMPESTFTSMQWTTLLEFVTSGQERREEIPSGLRVWLLNVGLLPSWMLNYILSISAHCWEAAC